MVIKTGNAVRDEVLKTFQRLARSRLKEGREYTVDLLLGCAVKEVASMPNHDMRDVRVQCPMGDPDVLAWCEKILHSQKKALKVSQIRSTNAEMLVKAFMEDNDISCGYRMYDSYVNLFMPLPTGQQFRVKISFKRLEDGGFNESLVQAYRSLCEVTSQLGRVLIKWW